MEIPLWVSQTIFGALLVAILGYVSTGILAPLTRDYLEKRKAKRLVEKEKLESKVDCYQKCVNQIEFCTKDALDDFKHGHGFYREYLSEEAKKKVDDFNDYYELCSDLLRAVEYVIPQIIQMLIKSELPETAKTGYALDDALQEYELKKCYIAGEKVSVTWLKENKPRLLDNIRKNLKDSESQLDTFFISLNGEFKNNSVLNRYRKEKKKLTEFGNQIINDLKSELKSLQKELSRFQ
jgi:hypothetical protein